MTNAKLYIMSKKTTSRGGLRPNGGRKPVDDKKIPITLYIRDSAVKRNGGKDKFRDKVYERIIDINVD